MCRETQFRGFSIESGLREYEDIVICGINANATVEFDVCIRRERVNDWEIVLECDISEERLLFIQLYDDERNEIPFKSGMFEECERSVLELFRNEIYDVKESEICLR